MKKQLISTILAFPILFTALFTYITYNKEKNVLNDNTFITLSKFSQGKLELDNTILWRYSDDNSKRIFMSGTKDLPADFLTVDITTSPTYQTILLYHKENLCYITRVTELPEQSVLRLNIIDRNTELSDINNVFYIACPIYKQDKLSGYVSSVFTNNGNGIVIYLQHIRLLKNLLEVYIK